MSSSLETALQYRRKLGWSIIPIKKGDKKPLIRWEPFQRQLPTEDQLRKWFSKRDLNLALVLGFISKNVYGRDFDIHSSYPKWASEYPDLARTLPMVRTARGNHVYFQTDQKLGTQKFRDGELRGDGSYLLLPPSIHPSGHVYIWGTAMPQSIPFIDPSLTGLLRNWNVTEGTEGIEGIEGTEVVGRCDCWGDIVNPCIPIKSNENHHRLFNLARRIKGVEKQRGTLLLQKELREVFDLWHTKTPKKFLRNDYTDYFCEFLEAYEDAKHPFGDDIIKEVFEQAIKAAPPDWAQKFDQGFQVLICLCRELQALQGKDPFYLSCRKVQSLFNLGDLMKANRWLNTLVRMKVLEKIKPDNPWKALRFRYRDL